MATTQTLRKLGTLYEEGRTRITELVSELPDTKSIEVPAVAPWTVHNLVSHLAGNCADVAKGNIAGLATAAWTNDQVQERQDLSTADVLEEWAEIGPMFASVIDDFPGRYGLMTVGDVTVHEHDIRAALGRPGARDSAGVEVATDFVITVIVDTACRALGLGPLAITAGERRWVVGTGEPGNGDPEAWRETLMVEELPSNDADPDASVVGDAYEVFRCATGRRSADQIRRLRWSVDPEPFLPIFGYGPFEIRSTDLDE